MAYVAKGYIVRNKKWFVNTVADHERMAKLNYLMMECRIQMYDSYTNGQIDDMWERYHGEAECIPVALEPIMH